MTSIADALEAAATKFGAAAADWPQADGRCGVAGAALCCGAAARDAQCCSGRGCQGGCRGGCRGGDSTFVSTLHSHLSFTPVHSVALTCWATLQTCKVQNEVVYRAWTRLEPTLSSQTALGAVRSTFEDMHDLAESELLHAHGA